MVRLLLGDRGGLFREVKMNGVALLQRVVSLGRSNEWLGYY